MDKTTVLKIARTYADKVAAVLQPHAVVLFGSWANGNARPGSDIDIAVIFDGFEGKWLETSSLLWRLRRDISDDVEPILLDLKQDRSGFAEDVLKSCEVIYQSEKHAALPPSYGV